MQRDVGALEDRTFDLLVIGGGILGATTAWDAAQRGLSVALVEAGDFGGGTSWNSLKTIHGGLRHLQHLDIAGLREGVRERRALLRIAPSVVSPLSFVVPAHGYGTRSRAALRIALGLYGLLSRDRNDGVPVARHLGPSRMLSGGELCRLAPIVDSASGGALWQDAQLDRPEALLLGFVRAAAGAGAVAANYVEATVLRRENGRVVGAQVRDRESEREATVHARVVVVAVGHALDPLLTRSGLPATGIPWLSAINLVLRCAPPLVAFGGSAGPRHLFAVPWRALTMVGTDYVPHGRADAERVAAFARDAAAAFPGLDIRTDNVALVHHGFVPGTDGAALWSRDALLDHRKLGEGGLIALVASKYTTARATAEKTVDRVLADLGRAPVACRTDSTPLPIPDADADSLEDRVRRAAREEMALHLADVVLRRLDVGAAGAPPAEIVEAITGVMAEALGWEGPRAAHERHALEEAYRIAPGPL
jgi:glycerol-3-phosphate dehydrogenase